MPDGRREVALGDATKRASFLTLLNFAAFSIVSVRERRGFWTTMPSKILVAALIADVLIGSVLTFVGLPRAHGIAVVAAARDIRVRDGRMPGRE